MNAQSPAEQAYETSERLQRRVALIYAAAVLFCFAGAGAVGWDILWISQDCAYVRSVPGLLVAVLCAFIALPFLILYVRRLMRFRIRVNESVVEIGKGGNSRAIACDEVRLIKARIEAGGAMIGIHGGRFHARVRLLGKDGPDTAAAAAAALRARCRNAACWDLAGTAQLPAAPTDPGYPLEGLEFLYRRRMRIGVAQSVYSLACGLGIAAFCLHSFLAPPSVITITGLHGETLHVSADKSPSAFYYCILVAICLYSFFAGYSAILQARGWARRLREVRQRLQELGSSSRVKPGSP